MKRHDLIRRLTAALVAGAMALSLCAPALATADEPAAALQPGTYPEGSIAVVYAGKEKPIVVSENTPDILGDGTLAYKDGVLCSEKPVQSLYIDVNPEKTVDIRITTEEGAAAPGVLNIVNAHDVFLSGKVWGAPAVGEVYVACTGSLTVQNTSPSSHAAKEVHYVNLSGAETVLRVDDEVEEVVAPGAAAERYAYNISYCLTVKSEPSYTLTVENGYAASKRTGQASTRFYRHEYVTVYMERPTDALELDDWVLPEGLELSDDDRKTGVCSFYMPEEDITVGASWKKAENTEMELHVTYNDHTEVFTPQHLENDSNADVTFANNTFTIRFDFTMDDKDVKIQGLADPKTGAVPSVVLDGIVMGSVYADGVNDLTVRMPEGIEGTLVEESVEVSASGDVTLVNAKGNCVGGNLSVRNARNVTVDANTADAEDTEDYRNYALSYDAKITCSGDVTITNAGGGVRGDLTVYAAQDVTVSVDSEDWYAVYCETDIACTGDVTLTNASGAALDYPLTIADARNVTITGKTDGEELIGDDNDDNDEEHSIRCSGVVTLRNEGTGGLFTNQLTYTPDGSVEVYDIAVDGEVKREGATDAVVLTCGRNTVVVTSDVTDPDAPAAEWDNDLTGASELVITPTLKPVDPGEAADGDGSAVVAVVAGTALAGAAVWGGYEVTTRVMLKNLLPEGAAIPATRGELALLLWNAAGRPEAGAVVTVYPDITDADQQAAARWCTEQGLLTARSDGTFAPDGRVPKWRVIEVWNHAFAK